ncbi:MobC family plasmid mobilization relaxosome protein [bacterium]|nr:MobC family plasmid mobilization relaxosome protein [bacterium]MBU1993399.1 MobC family plasmid mobilization relaxosome protein [bacterium]
MSKTNYQKEYKKSYKQKNKIVTFPLSIAFHDELKRRAIYLDLKTNSYAKNIITTFLNNSTPKILTYEQKEFINEYIRISRGIANNINQIAHKTNLNETIDINILINALRIYEDEFKKFITKS